jgi:hypothetical protein
MCRSILFIHESKAAKKYNTKTNRPICSEDLCPFYFIIYYSHEHKRWFIPKQDNGNCCHHGHPQLSQDQVHIPSNKIDEKILKRVLSQLQSNISISSIRVMLGSETGCNLSYGQIASLRPLMVIGEQAMDTPAERLLAYLKQSDNIRFVALTSTRNRDSLITLRISKKERMNDEYIIPHHAAQDQEHNPTTYAQQVMNALRLKNDEALLLCVAWITEEGE